MYTLFIHTANGDTAHNITELDPALRLLLDLVGEDYKIEGDSFSSKDGTVRIDCSSNLFPQCPICGISTRWSELPPFPCEPQANLCIPCQADMENQQEPDHLVSVILAATRAGRYDCI